ncbi:MAG: signal peptide peptidase SppA [Psychromonas sp.]
MKRILSLFKGIFRLINFTRLLIINAIFFLLLAVFIFALNIEDEQIIIADGSLLHLNFKGNIVEQKTPIDFASELSNQLFASNDSVIQEYQIDEVLQSINFAQHDPKISGILLELEGLNSASINHLQDIGKAINEFKQSGKSVTAIADNYSQGQYLLASYADEVILSPQGMVLLQGYSVYRLYFKEALDKMLITPHVFKVGTYKSFVEPFTDNKMSEESKIANKHWLNQLWKNYIDTIIAQRKDTTNITEQSISPTLAQLKSAFLEAGGNTALYAKNVGLIDSLQTRSEAISSLKQQLKETNNELALVSYSDYQLTLPDLYQVNDGNDQIALIHANGEILAGNQKNTAIGGTSFSKLLTTALNDDKVKAVVIRIDSPGGSAFASEQIRQQILALKKADKKVVASMGSVAASGGYWIASAADHIIATPTTLTGSIGIFGMFASADKALNKFGIYNDGVGTSELSTLSPTRALNPELADIIQIGIESGYQQFLQVVAEGRNLTIEEVDKVAQGRVWTGVDAKTFNLVDQLGTLDDAITAAAELAELNQYDIKIIEEQLSTKDQLMNELLSVSINILPQSVQANNLFIETFNKIEKQTAILTKFNDPQGKYAYCPMCFVE